MRVGQAVLMSDPISKLWDRESTIKSIRPSGRCYVVDMGHKLYKRNLRYLKPAPVKEVAFISDQIQGDGSAPSTSGQARPGRRSCLAGKAERRRFLHGEEQERGVKRVSWATPISTCLNFPSLQTQEQVLERDGRQSRGAGLLRLA